MTSTAANIAMAQAYQIIPQRQEPDSDFEYEFRIVDFPGRQESTSGFWSSQTVELQGSDCIISREQGQDGRWHVARFTLPDRIVFETMGDYIQGTDFPDCFPAWPIMSRRMLETLLTVGTFPHQVVPVIMRDQQVDLSGNSDQDIESQSESDKFVAVQLLEHIDVFDWQHSIYTLRQDRPDRFENIETLVFKELERGLPPLFRVDTISLSPNLYISPEAKYALEAAGILGYQCIDSAYTG